jgi:2-C-methyl-D-erythritol 4-phosphate cytidylyltransferase
MSGGFLSRLRGGKQPPDFTSAVIVAAGKSERFSTKLWKKQFHELAGIPSIVYTLRAFEQCKIIHEIVLVTQEEDIPRCRELTEQYGITKCKCVIAGGEDRQSSAKKGFDAITPTAEFVAIHDGARCLITPEIIEKVVRAAIENGAAIAAEPSHDTVKLVADTGFVKETPDRRLVWLAKTPQVFLANMYRAALYTAEKDKYKATDDSMLVERLGFKVLPIDCGHENIKLTYPIDAAIAEAILAARRASPAPTIPAEGKETP